jgi:proteasome lid subunit RPN8/RPN11
MALKESQTPVVMVTPAPPGPLRDADQIESATLPKWPMPPRVMGRRDSYQVLIRRSVLNDIRAHAQGQSDVEVCGVLVGTLYRDAIGPWGFVAANIRGNYASGRNAQVTFTSQTWSDIHRQMEERYPKQRIIGWYHSHPGFGIFLSEMDVFIQENFFSAPWQIAFVDDPKGEDRGLFIWRAGVPVREDFLIDEDLGPTQPQHSVPAARTNNGESEMPLVRPRPSIPVWLIAAFGLLAAFAMIVFMIWWSR